VWVVVSVPVGFSRPDFTRRVGPEAPASDGSDSDSSICSDNGSGSGGETDDSGNK
jgi:hypothetical protein